jgi:hypothetical protein
MSGNWFGIESTHGVLVGARRVSVDGEGGHVVAFGVADEAMRHLYLDRPIAEETDGKARVDDVTRLVHEDAAQGRGVEDVREEIELPVGVAIEGDLKEAGIAVRKTPMISALIHDRANRCPRKAALLSRARP